MPLNPYKNRNYCDQPWGTDFVGIECLGGTGKQPRKFFVVRIPGRPNQSIAIKRCHSLQEAEAAFRASMPKWRGEVPYRDSSYHRKRNGYPQNKVGI